MGEINNSLTELVNDTTPQLGGDLDANGNDVLIDMDDKLYLRSDTNSTAIWHNSNIAGGGGNASIFLGDPDDGSNDVEINSPSGMFFQSNTGLDGSGNWEPFLEFNADGHAEFTNTNQGTAGNRYLELNFTDSIRLQTAGTGIWAKLEADNLTTSDKTFQFPDTSGTILISEGAQVWNDSGAAVDFRFEGGTEENLLFLDGSEDKVGIGTASPTTELQVIGNYQLSDAATGSETKGYRFRTSGSNLDLDAAGTDLIISVFSGAEYTGTQREKMRLESGADIIKLIDEIQFTDGPFGSSNITIDGATGVVDFLFTMGTSTADPTADAPDDWVEIAIGGVTHYLPAYT